MNTGELHDKIDLEVDAENRAMEEKRKDAKKAILSKGQELAVLVNHLKQNLGPHLGYGFCWRWEQVTMQIEELLKGDQEGPMTFYDKSKTTNDGR